MTNVSREYAEALFSLAVESNQIKETEQAFSFCADLLEENPQYLELLASPAIPAKERVAVLEEALGKLEPSFFPVFLKLLCRKGHIRSLPECKEEFNRLLRDAEHRSVAQVVSAVPLSEDDKNALIHKLEGVCHHTVTLDCQCDPSLIGGMVVHLDGQVLDGSLRRRLREIKEMIR